MTHDPRDSFLGARFVPIHCAAAGWRHSVVDRAASRQEASRGFPAGGVARLPGTRDVERLPGTRDVGRLPGTRDVGRFPGKRRCPGPRRRLEVRCGAGRAGDQPRSAERRGTRRYAAP